MKAIEDQSFKIRIDIFGNPDIKGNAIYAWNINVGKNITIDSDNYRTEKAAKKSWEQFAKLNGIKNWKYVR